MRICLLLRELCRYLPPIKLSAMSCEVSFEISVLLQIIIWHLEEILPGVILMPVSNLSESGEAATSMSCQNVTCQYWRCFAYDKYYQPLYTAAIPWNIDANTRQLDDKHASKPKSRKLEVMSREVADVHKTSESIPQNKAKSKQQQWLIPWWWINKK